jgi:bifunctional oligoribonuclease and PAP phosphatase NrnA
MQFIQEIYPQLQTPAKVVITTHQKPDGDAMGSSLGLYHFLKQFGHSVTVISPTNWAHFLDWMPGVTEVIDYESRTQYAETFITDADWLFCVDFNTPSRVKKMETSIRNAKAIKVLIDHHEQPDTNYFNYGVSDTQKSSTCQMVYEFIAAMGQQEKITKDIASCLFTGLVTDTGSFRFASATAEVHEIAAHLKKTGINHTEIYEAVYDNFTENRFRFIGNMLLNRMEVLYEYNTVLIAIPKEDILYYGLTTGDTEGLVNYGLAIEGIKMAAIVIDRIEEVKCSFRSKGNVDVNSFARKYFNGGGHFNAAGGGSKEPLDIVVKNFKKAIHDEKEKLR